MKKLKEIMFGGENAEAYNALMSALWELAGGKDEIYQYLEETPKTSLVVEVVDKLKELGYSITPAPSTPKER